MRYSGWLDRLFPSPRWDEVTFWALDLETTGLQPKADRILSVGMAPIRGGVIRYGERYATLVRPPEGDVLSTEGLRAHHILPGETAGAPSIDDVVPEVDRRIREGVLLLHFKSLDLGFLRRAYERTGRRWPRPRVVDTIDLLLRHHQRQQQWTPHPAHPRTALPDARESLGLPAYPQHDALSDALATAELFLVLRSRLGLCRLRSFHR
jgi:DNA polymerase III subunit epsilon